MLQASPGYRSDDLDCPNLLLHDMVRRPVWLDVPVATVTLERGQILIEEGQVPSSVVFPEGALLADIAHMSDGRSVEVAAVGRDGAANLLCALSNQPASYQLTVKVGGPARVVKAASVRDAAQRDPALLSMVLSCIQRLASEGQQSVACSLVHDATQRLARELLLTRRRTASDLLPLTQEDFATTLGVQRTTLNASALQLKADGAIRYSRGRLRVLNPEKLADRACECHSRFAASETLPRSSPAAPVLRSDRARPAPALSVVNLPER